MKAPLDIIPCEACAGVYLSGALIKLVPHRTGMSLGGTPARMSYSMRGKMIYSAHAPVRSAFAVSSVPLKVVHTVDQAEWG